MPSPSEAEWQDQSVGPNVRRALLVEDDPFANSLLRSFLASAGFEVAAALDSAQALDLIMDFDPDVALLDLDLGDGPTGLDLAERIREQHPWTAIVLMSTHRSVTMVDTAHSVPSNFFQFVVKTDLRSVEDLKDAIDKAIRDDPYVPATIDGLIVITATQANLLRLMAEGLSNAEIARQRQVSPKSVEQLTARLYRTLGLPSSSRTNPRAEAIKLYRDGGVIAK